jgi:hypothetical protein
MLPSFPAARSEAKLMRTHTNASAVGIQKKTEVLEGPADGTNAATLKKRRVRYVAVLRTADGKCLPASAYALALTEMQDDRMGYSSRVLSSCSGTMIAAPSGMSARIIRAIGRSPERPHATSIQPRLNIAARPHTAPGDASHRAGPQRTCPLNIAANRTHGRCGHPRAHTRKRREARSVPLADRTRCQIHKIGPRRLRHKESQHTESHSSRKFNHRRSPRSPAVPHPNSALERRPDNSNIPTCTEID